MPVANEEATMEGILKEILGLPYPDLYIYPIVDSYSKDRTEEIIRRVEETTDKVKCIFYKGSQGMVSCYLEGFRQALADGAEWVIEMDGGGSHQPGDIHKFIEKLEEGYECVWGSRFVDGGRMSGHPLYRVALSSGGTLLANLVLRTRLKDMTSGFEAFQRHVLEQFDMDEFLSKGHMYQTEMRYYCRERRSVEVPIHYMGGGSVLKPGAVMEALRILFQLKKNESLACPKNDG